MRSVSADPIDEPEIVIPYSANSPYTLLISFYQNLNEEDPKFMSVGNDAECAERS